MTNTEKKYISDEIRDIAFGLEKGWVSPEIAAAKLWQLSNELREELKQDAQ